jgi:hypothetical protein
MERNTMHTHQRLLIASIFALATVPLVSFAAEPPATQVQGAWAGQDHGTYEGNPFYSGGIGVVSREKIATTIQGKYNLKLEFALKNGDYIAHVKVRISNERGKTVMDALSSGPWFLTRLEPGIYKVWVSGFGREFEQAIAVPREGTKTVLFDGWERTT